MTVDPEKLEKAVRRWIDAEWCFRQGPNAYGQGTGEELLRAEDKLRRALTGRSDLVEAYYVARDPTETR